MSENRYDDLAITSEVVSQPGWQRDRVSRDGRTLGYIDRHQPQRAGLDPEAPCWLPCTAQWDAVGDRAIGFESREAALDALLDVVEGSES